MSTAFSPFATRVMKDLFSNKLTESEGIKNYSTTERLEIVKMFDLLGEWPECICPESLFVPDDNHHLAYFADHYPDYIEVVDIVRKNPKNKETTKVLIDLAIKQMNDHSNPGLQRIHISDFEILSEENGLYRLMEAVKIAQEKWTPVFKEIDEKERILKEKELDDEPIRRIIEAREFVKDASTAWRARILVRPHLKEVGSIGNDARAIAKAAEVFD